MNANTKKPVTSSFQTSLLAKLSATTAAAKAVVARKEAQKRAAIRTEENRETQLRRQKESEVANRIIHRSVSRSRSSAARRRAPTSSQPRRRSGGGGRGRNRNRGRRDGDSDEEEDLDDDGVKDDLARTSRAAISRRNRGVGQRGAPAAPPKPLPGMEFVVRKTERKVIPLPHTSDYSDMFGPEFSLGFDSKVHKNEAKESAIATKEAQRILSERKEKNERSLAEAKAHMAEDQELERQGKLTTKMKNSRRVEASARDWVAVDVPVPIGAPRPDRLSLASSSAADSRNRVSNSVLTTKEKVSNVQKSKNETQARRRALAKRISALGSLGGPSPSSPTPPQSAKRSHGHRDSDDDLSDDDDIQSARKKRKPSVDPFTLPHKSPGEERRLGKRRPAVRDADDRHRDGNRRRDVDDRRRNSRRREEEEPPRRRRRTDVSDEEDDDRYRRSSGRRGEADTRGYNSEDWSVADDDDGPRGGFNDMDDYDEEELESTRVAAAEEAKEKLAEKRRKKIKERRRQEAESSDSD